MPIYQNQFWGYELHYPENWNHKSFPGNDTEAFSPLAFDDEQDLSNSDNHLLIRCEWMFPPQPIERAWRQHIGISAGMMGAKNVGSAQWLHADVEGFESEIVLPKRSNQRLWAGILAKDFMAVKFMLTHPRKDHDWMQPQATEIIKGLWFPETFNLIIFNELGVPLPAGARRCDPGQWLPDIRDPDKWSAFEVQANLGMLQNFFLREVRIHGWEIVDFSPFTPSVESSMARLRIKKSGKAAVIGILPDERTQKISNQSPGIIIIKNPD